MKYQNGNKQDATRTTADETPVKLGAYCTAGKCRKKESA